MRKLFQNFLLRQYLQHQTIAIVVEFDPHFLIRVSSSSSSSSSSSGIIIRVIIFVVLLFFLLFVFQELLLIECRLCW